MKPVQPGRVVLTAIGKREGVLLTWDAGLIYFRQTNGWSTHQGQRLLLSSQGKVGVNLKPFPCLFITAESIVIKHYIKSMSRTLNTKNITFLSKFGGPGSKRENFLDTFIQVLYIARLSETLMKFHMSLNKNGYINHIQELKANLSIKNRASVCGCASRLWLNCCV